MSTIPPPIGATVWVAISGPTAIPAQNFLGIADARVVEVTGETLRVALVDGGQEIDVEESLAFRESREAFSYIHAIGTEGRKALARMKIQSGKYLSGVMAPHTTPILTHNPLRVLEPNIVFTDIDGQGKTDNPKKIWSHVALSLDRIDVLSGCLDLLEEASDFAKRTLGAYMLLELHASFEMLTEKRQLRAKPGDPNAATIRILRARIQKLLKASNPFAQLRDKIVAHLDGQMDALETAQLWQQITRADLFEWRVLLRSYVNALKWSYPAQLSNLRVQNQVVPGAKPSPPGNYDEYVPFEPPSVSKSSVP